jgi:hypothetical protein
MTDIDSSHRRMLTRFCVYQMNNNPAGIGNECTHWIYAALFEARALDSDKHLKKGDGHLNIAQSGLPYTWGRPIEAIAAQPGDIAQFRSFSNTFFIFQTDDSGGFSTLFSRKPEVRGPNHTGMVYTVPRSGTYYQLESHLHQEGQTVMRVRGNTIYYESFALALSADELKQVKGSQSWPSGVNTSDLSDMRERVDWAGLRDKFSIPLTTASKLIDLIHKNEKIGKQDEQIAKQNEALAKKHRSPKPLLPLLPIKVGNKEIAVLFVTRAAGDLKFYCPQQSSARLAMNASQLDTEKAKVIDQNIKGGRKGHSPTEDEFGGDNKKVRLHDHRFDWSFPPPSP